MNPLSLVKTTLNVSIAIVRLPLDTVNRLLGRNGLEVDAAAAAVRESAGQALGDQALQAEGARGRVATEKRTEAVRLREAAQEVATAADAKAKAKKDEAAAKRARADQDAQAEKQAADKRAKERKRKAAEQERQRKGVAEKAAAEKREAAKSQGKRSRLKALDEGAEAMQEREDALVAAEEADRLKAAATSVKAARKS